MENCDDVASILSKLDLHDIEEIISQPYHQEDPGRPPRSPLGIFKALIVKQLRNIPRTGQRPRRMVSKTWTSLKRPWVIRTFSAT